LDSDRVVIRPRVLAQIAGLMARTVPGVARLQASWRTRLARWVGKKRYPGVRLRINDDEIAIELYIIASAGFNLLDVSHNVQDAVIRAVGEMTDMQVRRVDIHIVGVRAATYS